MVIWDTCEARSLVSAVYAFLWAFFASMFILEIMITKDTRALVINPLSIIQSITGQT